MFDTREDFRDAEHADARTAFAETTEDPVTRTIEGLLVEVRKRWTEQGIQAEQPATSADLRESESSFNVQFPDDFATYLRTLGGMKLGIWDRHLIRFWPLSEIRPVEGTPSYEGYFVFADYSISAHEYAVQCGTPKRSEVVLVGTAVPHTVAGTFSEFLARYLDDVNALFV